MPRFIPLYREKEVSDEPEVRINHKDDRINITYLFPGFTISEDKRKVLKKWKRFHEVKISGGGFLSILNMNEPLIPSFGRFVWIPPFYRGVLDINPRKSYCLEYKIKLLTPAQENARGEEIENNFDEEDYRKDKFYPENDKCVECTGPYYLHGYKVLLIHVRPLQYNPNKEVLRAYGKVSVYIKLVRSEMAEEEKKLKEWALTDLTNDLKGFRNLILNPDMKFSEQVLNTEPSIDSIDCESITQACFDAYTKRLKKTEFLIIHGTEHSESAQTLKQWKMKRGIKTDCVNIQEIVSGANDTDKPRRIKDCIRYLRGRPYSPLRYVLLFGDVGQIPVSQESSLEEKKKATDHYYYTHMDPRSFSDCILPWVAGGRIPVKEKGKGKSIVDQIIQYERNPPIDTGYYKRITGTAYFQDRTFVQSHVDGDLQIQFKDGRAEHNFIKSMEEIRKHMRSEGFEVKRVYTTEKPPVLLYRDGTMVPQCVRNNIKFEEKAEDKIAARELLIECIKNGQLIVVNMDHGLSDRWRHPEFRIEDLKSINSDFPCIIFSINCLTGSFHDPPKDCFAQKILEYNVSPSLIAASEDTWRWHNESIAKALFDAIWPGIIPTFPKTNRICPVKYCRIADILNYAKAYLLVKHGSHNNTREQIELYHIIGDPTLEIWRNEPSIIRLGATISGNNLEIKMSKCPDDAVITIWSNDEFLDSKKPLRTSENIALKDIHEKSPDLICFSAPGYLFAEVPVCFKQNVS